MEYVPKHTTENIFHFLMVKSQWFVMFLRVFVVKTIWISCDGSIVFYSR